MIIKSVKKTKKHIPELLRRLLPLLLMGVAFAIGLYFLPQFTAQDLAEIAPSNLVIAMLVIWIAFAVKSLAMVFPVMAIYMASGLIFPAALALAVNLVGAVINAAIPYFIGRYSCSETAEKIIQKHPNIRKVDSWTKKNSVLSVYLLRIVGFLPGDVVSLFCGAYDVRILPYFIGSLLGKLPVLVLATLMGTQLDNIFSLHFLLPFIALVILSLSSSFFASWKMRRDEEKKKQGKPQEKQPPGH